jgi:hypothetical protein
MTIEFSSKNDNVSQLIKFGKSLNQDIILFDRDFGKSFTLPNFSKCELESGQDFNPELYFSFESEMSKSELPFITNSSYTEQITVLSTTINVNHNLNADFITVDTWCKEDGFFYNHDCLVKIIDKNNIELEINSYVEEIKVIIKNEDKNIIEDEVDAIETNSESNYLPTF